MNVDPEDSEDMDPEEYEARAFVVLILVPMAFVGLKVLVWLME